MKISVTRKEDNYQVDPTIGSMNHSSSSDSPGSRSSKETDQISLARGPATTGLQGEQQD